MPKFNLFFARSSFSYNVLSLDERGASIVLGCYSKKEDNMSSKIEEFYKRWDIEYDEEKQFEEFKNRFLRTFDSTLGQTFLQNSDLRKEYLRYLALEKEDSDTSKYHPSMPEAVENLEKISGMTGYSEKLNNTELWQALRSINRFSKLVEAIQAIDWLDGLEEELKMEFASEIKKDINVSRVGVRINITESGFTLYPEGAEELDKDLVNDNLMWLQDYPEARNSFEEALQGYQSGTTPSDISDKLRKSLEALVRRVLDNGKNLENQKKELCRFLKNLGVPKEIRNIYWKILSIYAEYQNEYAKHGSGVRDEEIEFLIYLTGTFMRHLIINTREG